MMLIQSCVLNSQYTTEAWNTIAALKLLVVEADA